MKIWQVFSRFQEQGRGFGRRVIFRRNWRSFAYGRGEELEFLKKLRENIKAQNIKAKAAGLQVFYHIDLFVLPKALTEAYAEVLCSKETGRIDIDSPEIWSVHRVMLEEIFTDFPEVDGLIVRVGETYLYDTPYHVGTGAIREKSMGAVMNTETEQERYVRLLDFLREEVCVRHGKTLIFRTWDCYPDQFHASPDYYRTITNQIEPHENLLFSVKHTALDFWRRVKRNECLGIGKHKQIIEVQCQREYEGKGAYPNYIMDGVLDGFEEIKIHAGIRQIVEEGNIEGIYTWSRGGGWHGPYIKNELWCDLNAYVIMQYGCHPERTEEDLFFEYAAEKLGMDGENQVRFRKLCQLSARAVLKGRYCQAYDDSLKESRMPTGNWMRDDRLGGEKELKEIRTYLNEHNLTEAALQEKEESVKLWNEVVKLAADIRCQNPVQEEYIRVSSEYGYRLFEWVLAGWRAALLLPEAEDRELLIREYDRCYEAYRNVEKLPQAATLYKDEYMSHTGEPKAPGIGDLVEQYRTN